MPNSYLPKFTKNLSVDIQSLNPLTLASIGDSVQTLYVRCKHGLQTNQKAASLHQETAKEINAVRQSQAMFKILPLLTEEENIIYKSGRNSKTHSSAKNASCLQYQIATGFEALVGYLYLTKQNKRLLKLLSEAYSGT